jgi:hypothetical protein
MVDACAHRWEPITYTVNRPPRPEQFTMSQSNVLGWDFWREVLKRPVTTEVLLGCSLCGARERELMSGEPNQEVLRG